MTRGSKVPGDSVLIRWLGARDGKGAREVEGKAVFKKIT